MKKFNYSTAQTPQNQPIPGRNDMAKNNAGGYGWNVDKWMQLDRFLILGTEGGTYYVSKNTLDIQNANSVLECIKEDGIRAITRIVEISGEGRAAKNDYALFALAMASSLGDDTTRKAAFEALPKVARIGTHLFHFAEYRKQFAGWGRGMRNAVSSWYTDKNLRNLTYQLIKYRQRDGWSHRDLIRLAHPKTNDLAQANLFNWVTHDEFKSTVMNSMLEAYLEAQSTTDIKTWVRLILNYNLTREMLPTEALKHVSVWKALLVNMPITALIRNLGVMTANGTIKPLSSEIVDICNKLSDEETLKGGRIHPIQILAALSTYESGHGARGSLEWNPIPQILSALDESFYKTFKFVEPTNKNILIGLDVSASMGWDNVCGIPELTPAKASAALCMVTARKERNYYIHGFSGGFKDLNITATDSLPTVMIKTKNWNFGSTDCALPMSYAEKYGLDVDTFIIYTDSETWVGKIHPKQALDRYRQKTGINAKCIVVGMVANDISIADPNDMGMLDVVGFDTATPNIISNFIVE